MDDTHILACIIADSAGDSVAAQFKEWAHGAPLSEHNGNAMEKIRRILERVAESGNGMSEAARYQLDSLDPDEIRQECQF